jgi:hypothetical protein
MLSRRGNIIETKLFDESNGALSVGDGVGILSGKYQLMDGTTVTNTIGKIVPGAQDGFKNIMLYQ